MATTIFDFSVREGENRQDDLKKVAKGVMAGAWSAFPDEDMTITTIGGGITNLLFKVEGPAEESAILIRIYGQDTDVLIDRERDNDLFHELATMGFAPPFHGRFTNGRIEGFLPARPLSPSEMGQRTPVDFVSLIAREMARLHRLPVTKAGAIGVAELWQVLPKWLSIAKGVTFDDEAKTAAVAALDLDWMCQEVEWMEEQLSPSALSDGYGEQAGGTAVVSVDEQAKRFLSDVVLCHNDMLSGNVLHADGWDRVQVIDFEYSGYNHRGFDIANHFCEHAGFDSDFAKSYPTVETQKAHITAYVKAVMAAEGSGSSSTTSPCSDDEAFIEAVRVEADRWALPSHMSWAAWAVVQARYSPIDFDFIGYARLRLTGYQLHKDAFFGGER